MDWPVILLLIVLGIYAVCDWQVSRVWRSESSLWSQAYRMNPTDPRSAVNHAKHVFTSGLESEARQIIKQVTP